MRSRKGQSEHGKVENSHGPSSSEIGIEVWIRIATAHAEASNKPEKLQQPEEQHEETPENPHRPSKTLKSPNVAKALFRIQQLKSGDGSQTTSVGANTQRSGEQGTQPTRGKGKRRPGRAVKANQRNPRHPSTTFTIRRCHPRRRRNDERGRAMTNE
jgi:hypothetical protein